MEQDSKKQQQPSWWREATELTAFAASMWLAIFLSFRWGVATNQVVAIWPAAGIGAWVAIRYGWKAFPAIFISHLGYSLSHQDGLTVFALVTNGGNAVAYCLAGHLFRQLGYTSHALRTVSGMFAFTTVVAGGLSIVSAAVGTLMIHFSFGVTGVAVFEVAWRWFFSDFTAVMVITPIFLAMDREDGQSLGSVIRDTVLQARKPILPVMGLIATLQIATYVMPKGLGQYPIVLLTMPFCIWLALKAQARAALVLLPTVIIASLTITLLAVGDASTSTFLAVQLYGVVAMCTSLALYATAREKQSLLQRLADEAAQLESKVEVRTSELKTQAETDALTGLANRRLFEKRLQQIFEQPPDDRREHFLLFMDLDQFKIVNDTSGHAAGDELLRVVADLLRKSVRGDDLIGRLGGDEFAIILKDCPQRIAEDIAETIRGLIEELRFRWEDETYKIGVSIGVARLDATVTSAEDAQQIADAACYAAKNNGRNRVHLAHSEDSNVVAQRGEVRWAQRLTDAMEHDRFTLYGQRIKPVQLVEGTPDHIEVLVRLRDPEKKRLVPPGAFLPAAERYGLSTKLDEWVVRNLLRTLYLHQSFDAKRKQYWINLSGSSVGNDKFVDFLIASMNNSPVEPGLINFEITETAVIRNLNEAGRLMGKLHDMGCKFALDDFGTGLSSFSHLKKLPVDYLKIDGTFIRNILDDRIDQIFVQSIIDIAHSMGIKAVAEYVENEDIEALVTKMGADFVQGHAINQPKLLTPEFPSLDLLNRSVG